MRVTDIIDLVVAAHGVDRAELLSRSRRRPIVRWRHFVMFVARRGGNKLDYIACVFDRDHTTVSQAVRKWGE